MKRCAVGGQAVMEGVMMKNPVNGTALAVRRSDGTIVTEYYQNKNKHKKGSFPTWPVVRGVYAFVEALTGGMKITTRSAELLGEDMEEEPSKFEKWLSEKLGKSASDMAMTVAVVLAAALAVGLFVLLPSLVVSFFRIESGFVVSLLEGVARLLIFLGEHPAIYPVPSPLRHQLSVPGHDGVHPVLRLHPGPRLCAPGADQASVHPRGGGIGL